MSLDPRIANNPLRDWKREVVMVKDMNKKYFRLRRTYRLSYKGETKLECNTLKEIDTYFLGLCKKKCFD